MLACARLGLNRGIAVYSDGMVALSAWRAVVIALSLLLAAGCGYVRSGEWADDPANWASAVEHP